MDACISVAERPRQIIVVGSRMRRYAAKADESSYPKISTKREGMARRNPTSAGIFAPVEGQRRKKRRIGNEEIERREKSMPIEKGVHVSVRRRLGRRLSMEALMGSKLASPAIMEEESRRHLTV